MEISQLGPIAASVAVGYFLGSIPVAHLVVRSRGLNILETGNRNPGAANVFRTVSRPLGALVFALDALKAFLAVTMANVLGVELTEVTAVAGAAAIVGHWYPIFFRFKGGAGLAAALGASLAVAPLPALAAFALGLVTIMVIRNTGYAALVGYVGLVGLSLFLDTSWEATLAATLLAVMVFLHNIAMHRFQ